MNLRVLNTLWGFDIDEIEEVLLSDGIWYDISKEYTGDDRGSSIDERGGTGLTIYGHFGEKAQYFELRTWEREEDDQYGVHRHHGICIKGLVSQIKLLKTCWS